MRTGGVLNIIGKLLILISLFLLTPIPFSLYYHDGMPRVFLQSALIGAAAGGLNVWLFAPEKDMGYRDGFAVVVLSWLGLAFLGSLPYYFCGAMPAYVNCFFESMSGFTTTGSTILSTVEVLPPSVLFWRAMTHWMGGMGIIVLSLAILPLLGVGGTQLFQAEMPGPTKDRLAPRIQDTARILWAVYVLFTLIQILLLLLGGMTFFNAVCHAFATLATGGFSPHTASAGFYTSSYIHYVLIVFMFLAGINFSLHHRVLISGKLSDYWENEEFRLYLFLIGITTLIILAANLAADVYSDFTLGFRDSLFQVVSISTTTGFGTADFEQWPPVSKVLLLALMFVGGCAGSTGGGIKVVRILLFFKYARLQLHSLVHPRSVGTIKLGNQKVPKEIMIAILGFFALYVSFFLLASLVVTALGVDLVTGMTAVVATLNNVGPGLNQVGPACNFGGLPDLAKWVLSFCMLAGRLELYTVAVLLSPDFWKMARKPVMRWQLANGKSALEKQ
ncbi:MAG: potassium transporter [Desulfobulbaceae bacterium DB1]|nr:MAG: potassium transporter [Desulfobulbaceae bacterium DB1]